MHTEAWNTDPLGKKWYLSFMDGHCGLGPFSICLSSLQWLGRQGLLLPWGKCLQISKSNFFIFKRGQLAGSQSVTSQCTPLALSILWPSSAIIAPLSYKEGSLSIPGWYISFCSPGRAREFINSEAIYTSPSSEASSGRFPPRQHSQGCRVVDLFFFSVKLWTAMLSWSPTAIICLQNVSCWLDLLKERVEKRNSRICPPL